MVRRQARVIAHLFLERSDNHDACLAGSQIRNEMAIEAPKSLSCVTWEPNKALIAMKNATIEPPPAIHLRGVGFRREGRWILDDINWSVPVGACAAILGPNGSGKSTLTRIIGGQLWPTVGRVQVLGEVFGQVDLHALRRDLRLVQSTSPVEIDPELSALQVVLTGFFGTLGLYDATTSVMQQQAAEVLDRVGLHSVLNHRYTTLSSGERMRCLIGRALVVQPRLLLLDEPTAGLDLLAREQVLATVQALFEAQDMPPTVVLITHHLEELPPATAHVLLLGDGKVAAAGEPEKVLRAEVLSPVYRCPMTVRNEGGRYYAQVHPGAWESLLGR
jgi:iron complex transport system ATP-binding protein